jgi:hypothetical protein
VVSVVVALVIIVLSTLAHAMDVPRGEIWSAVLTGMILIGCALYSQAQHRSAVNGRRLEWLTSEGFARENLGRYWGFKGMYKGYFTRIYVDPESLFHKRLGPDLCILVYFQPMRRADGKRDIALLRRIEAEILNETSWVQWEFLTCRAIHMHQQTRFTLRTGRSRIQKRLDRVIGLVSKYGLKPWPEEEVDRWVQASPDLHGPRIAEFQENFTINGSAPSPNRTKSSS